MMVGVDDRGADGCAHDLLPGVVAGVVLNRGSFFRSSVSMRIDPRPRHDADSAIVAEAAHLWTISILEWRPLR
jgi:hypothetical protein